MNWNNPIASNLQSLGNSNNYEQKKVLAKKIASKVKNGDVIGMGSGSTSLVAIREIAKKTLAEQLHIIAIPTSQEVTVACSVLGIQVSTLAAVKPDWCFDGADEVDPESNLIKGRGGAMFAEKLVLASCEKGYILVDGSKRVTQLGEKFPIPIEVDPRAIHLVETRLGDIGAHETLLRAAGGKDGPVITEAGNYILDVRFPTIAANLENELAAIPGVIESGLFIDYPVEVLNL